MKIYEYIEKKSMTYSEFADKIGVSDSVVRLWCNEASTPRLPYAIKINELTKGRIKFKDMLSNKDRRVFK